MDDFNDLLTSLHGLNRWFVVAAGAVALGVAVAALVGPRRFGRSGRRPIWVFLTALAVQAGLGVLITTTASSDSEPFDGSTATLVWHALGGVLAIAFAATALIRSRRRPTDRTAARTAVVWTALGVLSVGDVIIGVALTAVVTAARLATARRIGPDDSVRPGRRPAEVTPDEA